MADDPKNVSVKDETLEDAAGGIYSFESLRKMQIGMDPETKKEARGHLNTVAKIVSPAYALISVLNKD